jgi:aryl sulfotransferase
MSRATAATSPGEHNHLHNATDALFAETNAFRPADAKVERPSADVHAYYRDWIAGRRSMSDFWDHVRSWWALRHQPNVYLLHYQNLQDDLEGRVADLADYLDIEVDAETMAGAVRHCGYAHMKANAEAMFPGMAFVDGGRTFINKGTNGRWRDVLSAEEIAEYEARALAELGPDCARWLATGRF